MQNTRQEIIDYLKRRRSATVAALSQALAMTRPNIRHHLDLLQEQGLLQLAGERPVNGRGRPTLVYMLAPAAGQDGLPQLVQALLDEINAEENENRRSDKLKRLAERLYRGPAPNDQPVTSRLNHAVKQLEQLHYEAHWEAHAEGPQVILGQCPYAAIIQHHPELCQMDRHLVEGLTGRPAEQVEKITYKPEGPHTCRFVIG